MNLKPYIDLIKAGEIVAFPTETVYGLGADAWNPSAIKKVFAEKGRPSDNPLIVHISNKKQLEDFAQNIPESAFTLIEHFWPGPLSLVLKKKPEVLDAVTAGLDSVAIRMPAHLLALDFIRETGSLVAPSANKSGRPSPTKAEHVRADFGEHFPVIDGAATQVGLESTVIDLTGEIPGILRPGSISKQDLESVLGTMVEETFFHATAKPRSPGQKYSHYKPNAGVRWLEKEEALLDEKTLYLIHSIPSASPNQIYFEGDLSQLARELYDRFRQADLEGLTQVAIEPFPANASPIAPALLNRIEKAIGK